MVNRGHLSIRGAALATSILLTLLLLTLGISFLTFCQHDLYFQRQQQWDRQAQSLARAGIEYYQYRYYDGAAMAPGEKVTREVVPDVEEFEVERDADPVSNSYTTRGRVFDGHGKLLAERVIYVPYGQATRSYDARL